MKKKKVVWSKEKISITGYALLRIEENGHFVSSVQLRESDIDKILKKRETINPIEKGEDEIYTTWYACPKCHYNRITLSDKYCGGCGRTVKYETSDHGRKGK